jgi:hypothetical protein
MENATLQHPIVKPYFYEKKLYARHSYTLS